MKKIYKAQGAAQQLRVLANLPIEVRFRLAEFEEEEKSRQQERNSSKEKTDESNRSLVW